MATLSRMAIRGMMMTAEPRVDNISPKCLVWADVELPISSRTEKGGGWKAGSPESISPVRVKVQFSGSSLQEVPAGSTNIAIIRQTITTIAFLRREIWLLMKSSRQSNDDLAVQMNQTALATILKARGGNLLQSA